MPPGVPVAAVGLDRGDNAAILAAEMIGIHDERVGASLAAYRAEQAAGVAEDSEAVRANV